MKKELFISSLFLGLLITTSIATATSITWNTQGVNTDVANGILSLDEMLSRTSYTYTNVGNAGFDIKISTSAPMAHSTGDLNYTTPGSSIAFEFFMTGTTAPLALSGFAIDWLDLDTGEQMGPFTIVDGSGNTTILDTSSSYFVPSSSVYPIDRDGSNSVNPDGLASSQGGNWNTPGTGFITDFSSIAITTFSIESTRGYIAPTSLTIVDGVDIQVPNNVPVPEPSAMLLFGTSIAGLAGLRLRRKKK